MRNEGQSLPAGLREGVVLATFMLVPRIEVAEMLALAGFDAAIVDLEHGPITRAVLPELAAALQGAGLYAIARTADDDPAEIAAVLDAGVDGVIVPHVSSAVEAEAVSQAAKYPPDGVRSLNPYVRGTRYGADGDLQAVNRRTAIFVMLESSHGLRQLDEISAVPGVDAIFIGPVDLSASLGFPGQPEHPVVISAVREIFDRLSAAGVCGAIYSPTPEAAARWVSCGASLVALSADSRLLLDGLQAAVDAFHLMLVSSHAVGEVSP